MKKLLIFTLFLLTLIFMTSCSSPSVSPNNNDDTTILQTEEQKEPEEKPLGNDDNSMFVYPENKREFVVQYIRDLATIKWSPKETFHLFGKYEAWNYSLTYKIGKIYYGLPFLVGSRGTKEQFENFIEDGFYIGETTNSDCIGNACYDAVYVSLIQVCPSITFNSTEDMLPSNNTGLAAVGDWDYSVSAHDTPRIIKRNSKQTMAKAYAQLEIGDVVLKHVVAQDAGHARIVSRPPVVTYKDDGSIDLDKSYITTIEQTNAWDKQTNVNTTWWVDHKYTFAELYKTNFVPLTPTDYNTSPQPFINALEIVTVDEFTSSGKLSGTLSSNHYIIQINAKITDSDGNVLYSNNYYPTAKKVFLEDLDFSPTLSDFTAGEYHLNIDASLSLGTKTVVDFDFIIK